MANNFNRDLYKILNVHSDASAAEIKAAYRILAKKYHPDAAGGKGDDTKFKEVQEAYEILSKPAERQKYDIIHGYYTEKFKKEEELKREEAKKKLQEELKKEQEKAKAEKRRQEAKEKKDSFSKTINEALDNLFHTQNRTAEEIEEEIVQPKIDGGDIRTEVSISFLEALKGAERTVNILHTESCPECGGRKIINNAQCSMCRGTGQMQTQKKIKIKIPKGVKNGASIKTPKQGEKGRNGGKDGDLYITVNIEKSRYIDTDGNNILINLPVSAAEAALGADVPVELASENVTVKIPPNTSSGQKLRLSGMGLEGKNKQKRGDCIITVIIKMPESLTEEEKQLYKKLLEISNFDARKDLKNAE